MLKYVLLAGAMVATPAMAQDAATAAPMTPGRTPMQATPAQDNLPQSGASAQQTTSVADPTMTGQSATPAQDAPAAAPVQQAATPAQAQPATSASQVAQVVDAEFGNYDKNGDGNLDATEFGAWMVALRSASDPATKADSPETKAWVTAAFTQADKDQSSAVTKAELTGFLSQGVS